MEGGTFALTGKEYFSLLDFNIASALHSPKDEFLFQESYANRNDHIPYLAALDLILTLINCSANYKETANMWRHAEEETSLWFYEVAGFLQPCPLCVLSCRLGAGIAVYVADLLLSYLLFLVDEQKSFSWLFMVPRIVWRHYIWHRWDFLLRIYDCFRAMVFLVQTPTVCAFFHRAVRRANEANCSPVVWLCGGLVAWFGLWWFVCLVGLVCGVFLLLFFVSSFL